MTRPDRLRRRRARHSTSAHGRARDLAAVRLDEALSPTDASWLDEHLATCDACRAIADAYAADRLALRGLRAVEPDPPRDLWARTAAAIEREKAGHGASPTGVGTRRRPPLGVLSGFAVVAVVIGASLISGGWLDSPATAPGPSPSAPPVAMVTQSPTPGPTPIAVGAGDVRWVGTAADGALAYNVTDIAEVCAQERQKDCAPIKGGDTTPVDLKIRPSSITKSPVGNEAIIVGSDGSGGDSVVVFALPTARTAGQAGPSATPTTTLRPTPPPTSEPPSSPSPSPDPSPTTTPGVSASTEPTGTPDTTPSETAPPTETPAPTRAANLAIATGVKVVGGAASYSPDGRWFAFTARAADGSSGPDIYVWRVGDEMAHPVTDDHASAFASWVGDQLVGSRAVGLTPDGTAAPESFLLDPDTGAASSVIDAIWRPVVGPHGRWAVGWDGSVKLAADGSSVVPADGSLIIERFRAEGDDAGRSTDVLLDGPIGDFDVRWDESGSWLAAWVADDSDPSIGRLSLFHLDADKGTLERPKGAPQDVTALPGFSIGNGRLAWATPPGQGGEGSRVQIVAWTDDAVGAVESGPVEGVILVH